MASDETLRLAFKDYLQDPNNDPEVTIAPFPFVRWLRERHPELVVDRNDAELLRVAEALVDLVRNGMYQRLPR